MGAYPRRAGLISRIGELRHNTIVILAGEWTAKTSGVGRGFRGVQCAHSSLHTRVMGEEVVFLYNIQHYQILEKFKRKKCICDLDIISKNRSVTVFFDFFALCVKKLRSISPISNALQFPSLSRFNMEGAFKRVV